LMSTSISIWMCLESLTPGKPSELIECLFFFCSTRS
jgi:hypothetical protein